MDKAITEDIYSVKFRKNTGAVQTLHFRASDDKTARARAIKFCNKNGFRFVFVKPFLTDLERWENAN